jgi:hypothetical protein
VATVVARNSNKPVVGSGRVWSQEVGFVGAFGRTLALVVMKMFSNVI